MNVQIDGPNGKDFSNVWVIKKQDRAKRAGQEDQVTVLDFYYIVGDAIYHAPSVAKIMTNRMVCLTTFNLSLHANKRSSPPSRL